MSDTVIKVENLSKKYILSHQGQEKYTALRDVLSNGVKRLGKKLISPFTLHSSQKSDSPFTIHSLKIHSSPFTLHKVLKPVFWRLAPVFIRS